MQLCLHACGRLACHNLIRVLGFKVFPKQAFKVNLLGNVDAQRVRSAYCQVGSVEIKAEEGSCVRQGPAVARLSNRNCFTVNHQLDVHRLCWVNDECVDQELSRNQPRLPALVLNGFSRIMTSALLVVVVVDVLPIWREGPYIKTSPTV